MILARLSLILALIAYGSSNSMSGTFQTLHLECTSKPEENSHTSENKDSGKNYDSKIENIQSRLNKLEGKSDAIKEPEEENSEITNLKNSIKESDATVKKLQSRIDQLERESNATKKLRPQSCSQIKDLNPKATTRIYFVYDNIFAVGKEVVCDMTDKGVEIPGFKNCHEILNSDPTSSDGVYTIYINPSTTINVYCEMNEGGWTVFQKRFDGSEDFRRSFNEYSEGFGDPSQEHWLGLNNIHQLTSLPGYSSWILRVDLESFEGETAYAQYEDFNVGPGTDYILSVGSYSGTAGNSMTGNNGVGFSTYDRDQDWLLTTHCAGDFRNGAWWFSVCGYSSLNAYIYNDERYGKGINWYDWKNSWYMPMKSTTMKIKPIM